MVFLGLGDLGRVHAEDASVLPAEFALRLPDLKAVGRRFFVLGEITFHASRDVIA